MQAPISFRATLLILALMPALNACVPALLVTGTAATMISFHDRRSTGNQADDETSEWKGSNRLPAEYRDRSHVNFTAFNRNMLVTGEVPSEEAKQAIGAMAEKIEGVRQVHNELVIAPPASFSSRSNDAFVSSKFKARLIDSNQLSANHIKPITENGTLFLMGLINEREAKVAVAIARTTDGVRKVVNVLEIIPEEETRRIDNALLGARTPPPQAAPVENR
ncbi:BON domain-containing protein [Ferribacterium limneticum]|uniref:BON domain-containing protein n=1 Tax=Ferribacterium limneticum TaxID=76259 RepID=UPI001CF9EA8A|nr:BON domain-containing protein [Ferribacterium limneticum]UCV27888.1 BON domain-containing protein [Ferribacterium limneticum]UCV31805.1 BON domain-containing protein [Ferribacterium limneticum]